MTHDMNEVLAAELRMQRLIKRMEWALAGANVLAVLVWLYTLTN